MSFYFSLILYLPGPFLPKAQSRTESCVVSPDGLTPCLLIGHCLPELAKECPMGTVLGHWVTVDNRKQAQPPLPYKQTQRIVSRKPLIIMYKFKTSRDQQQATLFTLAAQDSLVVVKAARLQASHTPQAQSRLLLEFVIHENHEEASTWSALQHQLKGKFDDVLAGDMLPFCSLKLHVFILQAGPHVQSTIANASWACLLLHGVPMRRSVFHYQWHSPQAKGKCILNLNDPHQIFSSQANQLIPPEAASECGAFKTQLTSFLSREWSR